MTEIEYESLPQSVGFVGHMVAGSLAGITEHAVIFPLDNIKVVSQDGIVGTLQLITKSEGIVGLFRGVTSVALGAGPSHALYFAVYEKFKELAGGDDGHVLSIPLAGALSTVVSEAIMNPFDVIKQRMQLGGESYSTINKSFQTILAREGFKAFYLSYPTTLIMSVPFHSMQFASYEALSNFLNPGKQYDLKTHFFAGGLAGGFAAALTSPFDVVKTLLQTRSASSNERIRHVSSFFGACKIIYKEKGLSGFYRGVKPRVIAHVPSTAICWATYESCKFFIRESM